MKSDKKINLLIVINNLNIGGAERLVVDKLKYFDREKFKISLLTLIQIPDSNNFESEVPKDVLFYKIDFKNFKDVRSWYLLYKKLKKIKPDVVISHLFFSNTVIRFLKPFFRFKVVSVEHNTYLKKTKMQIFVDKLLSLFVFKIVAVSKTVANFTSRQESIPISKFEVIHNGIDVRKIMSEISVLPNKSDLKKKLGYFESDKVIINVARLAEQKNQKLLINSFAEFSKKYPEYKLVILGEGGLRGELEDMVTNLGIESKVSMPGTRFPYPYYLISEFLILTSKIEGFATVGIEAMICGLPVVSTKTAGPDEYVVDGYNGFLTKSHSVVDVMEAMDKILASNLLVLSQNALKTAYNFDIVTNIKRYSDLCIQIFKNGK